MERQGQTREEAGGVWTGRPNMWPEFLSTKSSLLSITNQRQMHLSREHGWTVSAASADAAQASSYAQTPFASSHSKETHCLLVMMNQSPAIKSVQKVKLPGWTRWVSILIWHHLPTMRCSRYCRSVHFTNCSSSPAFGTWPNST